MAANRPFSTASVALKDSVIIELMMSSIRAYRAVSDETKVVRRELTAGRYEKCSVSKLTSELTGALMVGKVSVERFAPGVMIGEGDAE